jgi:hypothetical protein
VLRRFLLKKFLLEWKNFQHQSQRDFKEIGAREILKWYKKIKNGLKRGSPAKKVQNSNENPHFVIILK